MTSSGYKQQVYINLPVKNLDASVAFFKRLGYAFNPRFTDANAACMIVSDTIYVMLLVEPFFQTFTPKTICDAKTSAEVLVCLSCASRDEVDTVVRNAVAAGGSTFSEPKDHGFMYAHGYQDLDGHIWELIHTPA